MIHNNFSEYEDKIAVGFVGEGSERFGFDDVYSRDHDFGPGFCMKNFRMNITNFQKVIRALQELTPLWLKEEWAFV